MSNFAKAFENAANTTYTENGNVAWSTTSNALLDLFACIGGMRQRGQADIVNMWTAARTEDKELADNLILYARHVRSGLGERRIGRILLKELAKVDPNKVARNFDTIVEAGRWDDLFEFIGTPVESEMWKFVEKQLRQDIEDMRNKKPISLLGKWMKSMNTSSKASRAIAAKACVVLGLTPRNYRIMLTKLRNYIKIVETKMTMHEWNEIEFDKVPSRAMSLYHNAFASYCGDRFTNYLADVKNGKAKINAAALTPMDIVKQYFKNWGKLSDTSEMQWTNLPNFVDGNFDVVVMADTSGSMECCDYEPMAASVGLAEYFAEHNTGAYQGLYMTFSRDPQFIRVSKNATLQQRLDAASHCSGYNTDLDKAMKAIYEVAIQAKETPKALVIISDGEFDRAYDVNATQSIVSKWNKKYAEAGLNPVKIISWNVACRDTHLIAPPTDEVAYCSGYSASVFKHLATLISKTAYEAMVDILTKDVYHWK